MLTKYNDVTAPRNFTVQDKFPVLLRHTDGSLYLFHDSEIAYCVRNAVQDSPNGSFSDEMLSAYNSAWTIATGSSVTFTQD